MIAADTSSLVAYFEGEKAPDTERIDAALAGDALCLPPVVVTEMLSSPAVGSAFAPIFSAISLLELADGYWIRAGETRRKVIAQGFKARVADALIAQACIDHNVPLLTRDKDFRHFVKHCGLVLA